MTIPERCDEIAAEELAKQKGLRHLDCAYACHAYAELITIAMLDVVTLPSNAMEWVSSYPACYCQSLSWMLLC